MWNLSYKANIMAQIIKPNGKRKWVPKYGLTAIPKLIKIFNQLNPLRDMNKWPKEYRAALRVDSTIWKQILYSLITINEEENMTTVDNATAIFDILFQQFSNKDLWILLCENISETIKEETLYQNIIELVLLTALHEKDSIHNRIAEMTSLLSENPWCIMCKNIMPLVVDKYQKCYIVLLFLALSGQQKVLLLNYLTGNTEEMAQTNKIENIFSFLFMTQEHWVNLTQVVELLKRKREILRMLSIDAKCASDLPGNEDKQNIKPDTIMSVKKEDSIFSNKMDVENAGIMGSVHNEIKQNQCGDIATPVVKSEIYKVEEDVNTNVKKEPNINDVEIEIINLDLKQAECIKDELGILIKQEDTKVLKLENVQIKEEENVKQTNLDEIKTEPVCEDEDIIIVDKENEKIPPSLDQLILNYSIQQINNASAKFTINEDCINILSEDDDSDDCVIQEDNKLEVAHLFNMYHEIVDKPDKNVENHTAAGNVNQVENIIQNINMESEEYNDFERKPSSSSSISNKPDRKLNVKMSSQKKKNRMKRNRSKKNASVKKLFDKLREETTIFSDSTAENTVIVLDDTITPKKRKCTPNAENNMSKRNLLRYFNENVEDACTPIKLDNQNTLRTSSLVHCSTPIKNDADFIPITLKSNNNISAVKNVNEEVTDLTKEINYDSLITVDLTTETLNRSSVSQFQNTVIDLEDTANNADCSIVSVSNSNLSLSGESDVTVLNMSQTKKERQMRKFAKGISKLDASEKGRLLELITQNIFSGCNVAKNKGSVHNDYREKMTRATETAEDTFIKEVILGQAASRNSVGSNIYNPGKDLKHRSGLRMIVIDGSNVAMAHDRGHHFSVKGLKICIDYFLQRGHVVKAFVPRFRCKFGKSSDPRLLDNLERAGLVVYTPSREIQGRMITSYDDRYIVQCAAEFDGVIVSGDNYRDLMAENPRWRFVIENRLLQFTWVHDMIMFPRDPLGRNGPTLEQFLRHSTTGSAVRQLEGRPIIF